MTASSSWREGLMFNKGMRLRVVIEQGRRGLQWDGSRWRENRCTADDSEEEMAADERGRGV
jgi:hypothetical protein